MAHLLMPAICSDNAKHQISNIKNNALIQAISEIIARFALTKFLFSYIFIKIILSALIGGTIFVVYFCCMASIVSETVVR